MNLVENQGSEIRPFFDEKVAFPILEELNLQMVRISECQSLKYLFPASIARSLLYLEELYVENCGVEEIVGKEESEAAASFVLFPQENQLDILAKQPIFLFDKVFPNLEELTLSRKDMTMISQSQFHKLKVLQDKWSTCLSFETTLISEFVERFERLRCSRFAN
ncbi:hypothetical protein QYF36_018530 [Acer negundo]|nr:hypothetical protein QYF36_018530 [Acer negundo]